MKRDVLIIPLEEVSRHFETNERQDIKIVAPNILTDELYDILTKKGKRLKPEVELNGDRWERSYKTRANRLCESADFAFETTPETKGPFAISFANEKAEQEEHYHKHHAEIYFSEHRISGYYRKLGDNNDNHFELCNGGLVLFQPNIIHYMELNGLALILETPSIENDRFLESK
jgi:hypothetical protein